MPPALFRIHYYQLEEPRHERNNSNWIFLSLLKVATVACLLGLSCNFAQTYWKRKTFQDSFLSFSSKKSENTFFYSQERSKNSGNMIFYIQDFEPESKSNYEIEVPPSTPTLVRTPTSLNNPLHSNFLLTKRSVNMFDHPKILSALQSNIYYEDVLRICWGPQPNIDVYIDEKEVVGSLNGYLGHNVFSLDCRGYEPRKYRLIGFVVVMDMYGNLVNILDWGRLGGVNVESVSMMNTTTVLFGTERGAFHWNYINDQLVQLPFRADTHSLVYRETDDQYYGLYLDEVAAQNHNAQSAVSFDPYTGQTMWNFYYAASHFNYLSVEGDFAYCSSRQLNSLVKVDMRTNQVLWTLGGENSDFIIYNVGGNPYPSPMEKGLPSFTLPWGHQHKFQYLGQGYFSLFDNNDLAPERYMQKPWGTSSRCVILLVNEDTKEAWEVFSYLLGDSSKIYGGTDILPSGNILTSSIVEWVYPMNEDHQYHVNIWEISMNLQVPVWRVGFKGLNWKDPTDLQSPYSHLVYDPKNQDTLVPTGWNIYNVDRVYPTVLIDGLCLGQNREAGSFYIEFIPYNTIRTQSDAPGVAFLSFNGNMVAQKNFLFHKSWLSRTETIVVPDELLGYTQILLTVNNQWNDALTITIVPKELMACAVN